VKTPPQSEADQERDTATDHERATRGSSRYVGCRGRPILGRRRHSCYGIVTVQVTVWTEFFHPVAWQ
jgi:hypothetical protein